MMVTKHTFPNLFRLLAIMFLPSIITFLLISCADYEEDSFGGPYPSKKAFRLMTTKEKIMHDKIAEKWGQEYLTALREAVRRRQLVPKENEMPFGDIPGVIVMLNEVELAEYDNMSDSKRKARFENIDDKWYRTMKVLAEKGEAVELKGTPPPPTEAELAEMQKQKEAEMAAAQALGEKVLQGKNISVSEEKAPGVILPEEPVVWDPEDVVGSEEMSALKFPLMRCEQAQAYFDDIIKQGRPVVRMDMEVLEEMFSVCAATRLQEFYK